MNEANADITIQEDEYHSSFHLGILMVNMVMLENLENVTT